MQALSRRAFALAGIVCALFVAADASGQPRGERPIGTIYPGAARIDESEPAAAPAPPPCSEDCFLLSSLAIKGSVSQGMTFELKGTIRPDEMIKVPLFGPPDQVRIEDVTINGAPAQIAFDSDHYSLYTSAKSFTIRGKLAVGTDELLSVVGPVVGVETHLSSGRMVEGEHLSGVHGSVLHFDPMTGGTEKPKAPPIFRLARAIRFGHDTSFVYRVTAQESDDIGSIHVPLKYGEKVGDVQGSAGWHVDGTDLVLPVSGHDAEVTVSGTMPTNAVGGVKTYACDSRSAYEWWLFEADPDHRFDTGGEPRMVETSQSPIPPTFPGARVFLVQKGQSLDVDARSLVRGDVLAAAARHDTRFVAITGRGELISDETIAYDNNGLDHLMVTPAGKAMYLSTDKQSQRILHPEQGAREMLVPMRSGGHELRVQSLTEASLWPVLGAVKIPATRFPLTTGEAETTIGLPQYVHPVAVLGGDRTRWGFARGDLIAVIVGAGLACFGFRTRKTRAIAAVVTAGLWFVSKEAFVIATAGLFFAGAVFLASRFLRSTWLLLASGVLAVVTLFGGRFALADATVEPELEMLVDHPTLPRPEVAGSSDVITHGDPRADITPVSLSFPTSDRYVVASRQLVSNERPFEPRVVYVTTSFLTSLQIAWLFLVGLLVWAHKDRLQVLKTKLVERLSRRSAPPDPTTAPETPPF